MTKKLTKGKAKTAAAKAASALKVAAKAGARTAVLEEILEGAEAKVAAGDLEEALADIALVVREAREAKRYAWYERLLGNVRPHLEYAEGVGADVDDAKEVVEEARRALKKRRYGDVAALVRKAKASIDEAKRYRRHAELISNVDPAITKAEKMGANVSQAWERVGLAYEALKKGAYGEVAENVRAARKALDIAKRKRRALDSIDQIRLKVKKAEDEGVHVAEADALLVDAREALDSDDFPTSSKLAQKAQRVLAESRKVREVEVQIGEFQRALAELRDMKVDVVPGEEQVEEALERLKARDYAKALKVIRAARQWARRTRRQRENEIIITTVEALIDKAGKGGSDLAGARALLKDVETAMRKGTFSSLEKFLVYELPSPKATRVEVRADIEKARELVDQARRLGARSPEAEEALHEAASAFEAGLLDEALRFSKTAQDVVGRFSGGDEAVALVPQEAAERIWNVRRVLNDLRRANVEFGDGEDLLFRAEAALRDGEFDRFDALLDEIEGVTSSLTDSLRGAALGLLRKTEASIGEAKVQGLDMERAEFAFGGAQRAVDEERFADALEFLELARRMMAEDMERHFAEPSRGLVAAVEGNEVAAADVLSVDEAAQLTPPAPSEELAQLSSEVEEARERVARAETLTVMDQTKEALATVLEALESKSDLLAETSVAEKTLCQAEEAFQAGDFSSALNLAQTASRLIQEVWNRRGHGIEEEVAALKTMFTAATAMGVNLGDAEEALSRARAMSDEGDRAGASDLVREVTAAAEESVEQFLSNKSPSLAISAPRAGLQAGVWNKYVLGVANKGTIAAENVDVSLTGDFDVRGLEAIPRVGVHETKKLEVALRPKTEGTTDLSLAAVFNKPFEEAQMEVTEDTTLEVASFGTYLVEDVFVIHNDGRLIEHETRKFKDDVDEDIFSGMLTVVQEFVKDSFRSRAEVGLTRLDFGDSKILIERGQWIYLACVMVGEEPVLLPLYMAEVIKEVEERFGSVLQDWSGKLSDLRGIDDIINRLVYVPNEGESAPEALEDSVIAATVKYLKESKARGLEVTHAEELLKKAQELMKAGAVEEAWLTVQEAVEVTNRARREARGRMENAMALAREMVNYMDERGAGNEEVNELLAQAEVSFKKNQSDIFVEAIDGIEKSFGEAMSTVASDAEGEGAEEAMSHIKVLEFKVEKAKEYGIDVSDAKETLERLQEGIVQGSGQTVDVSEDVEKSLERARKAFEKERAEEDLRVVGEMISGARAVGSDVEEADFMYLTAQEAMEKGDYSAVSIVTQTVRELLEVESNIVLQAGFAPVAFDTMEPGKYLAEIARMLAAARSMGIDVGEAQDYFQRAELGLTSGDIERLERLAKKAESSVVAQLRSFVDEREPNLVLNVPTEGLHAEEWNRYPVEVTNQGDILARNVEVHLRGDFEVSPTDALDMVDANERRTAEVGLKPGSEGDLEMEVTIRYQKPFDDEVREIAESKTISVQSGGTYAVEDAFLVHNNGLLICHDSRRFLEDADEDIFTDRFTAIQDFVNDACGDEGEAGLKRMDIQDRRALVEKGDLVYLAAVVAGDEPQLLPLDMLEVIRDVEERYGHVLEEWSGDIQQLEGIQEIVHRLMFSTDVPDADLGPLADTEIGSTFSRDADRGQIRAALEIVEGHGAKDAWTLIQEMEVAPAMEAPQSQDRGEATELNISDLAAEVAREVGDLAEDAGFRRSLNVLNQILRTVAKARRKARLSEAWPVAEVAVKSDDGEVLEAVETFGQILASRARSKSVITLSPGEDWSKLDVEMETNLERIEKVHRIWARKIGKLLQTREPFTVWQAMKDGEYAVGVEGQRVVITPDMVSFKTTMPEGTVSVKFPLGTLFLDARQTEELEAEGFALEIIDRVALMKKDLGVDDETPVEIRIWAGDRVRALLEGWRKRIAGRTGSTAVKLYGEEGGKGTDGFKMDWRVEGETIGIELKQSGKAA